MLVAGRLHNRAVERVLFVSSECLDQLTECDTVSSECLDQLTDYDTVSSECLDQLTDCDTVSSECLDQLTECDTVTQCCSALYCVAVWQAVQTDRHDSVLLKVHFLYVVVP